MIDFRSWEIHADADGIRFVVKDRERIDGNTAEHSGADEDRRRRHGNIVVVGIGLKRFEGLGGVSGGSRVSREQLVDVSGSEEGAKSLPGGDKALRFFRIGEEIFHVRYQVDETT